MSDAYSRHDNDDVPRFDPWLAVLGSSLVPLALGVFARQFFIPLCIAGGVLFVAGIVMLKLHTSRQRKERTS